MKLGQQDDKQLTQYLNKLLDEMPLHEPSPLLTDRIMQSLQDAAVSKPGVNTPRSTSRPWMNGAIAIAATVLLIQSGMINKILHIASGISELTDYIQNLSQYH
ncbi:hypothetical protein A8709_10925 [Paenibacillus pectinilyticus]|uniref:Uncharacterized protein n=1 Tax=Paenibacillus pectinilyticus TaxID=512399 RepID=A0A1C1A2D4_9BACL|nr:hypothetical protein [Paenibacillus pectinilyticus]OCT14686.1 hypothetical protein A8709_10925 [Paenibacillus pectinilyticus]